MAYPSVSGGIQNTFLTPDVIAREALLILENNVISPQVMSTSAVADFTGAKVGDTIRVRRPAFFGVDTFARTDGGNEVIKIQDAKENSVNLVIEKHFDVSFEVSSVELALAVDDFNERLLQPAMSALSQKVDEYALSKIADLGGIQAPSTTYATPSSLADVAAIVERMNNQMIPMENRKLLVSPAMQSALYGIDAFVRADIRGGGFTSPVAEASLGRFMGLDTIMSQMLPSHTAMGTAASTASTDCNYATASTFSEGTTTININSGPNGTLTIKKGDTLRIDYLDGVSRDHVVTNDTAFTTNGGVANAITGITITPGLYGIHAATAVDKGVPTVVGNGALVKNVTTNRVSADNTTAASSDIKSSYVMGAAFHPSAFQMVFAPLANPMGPGTSSSTVNYNGMSLRVLQTYDHEKKRDIVSVDCLVGVAAVDGRLGVKIPAAT
tara:strand:- start:528 stop:1850 length:1323 start_codon:yes stop_codon:yes gene_type:complete